MKWLPLLALIGSRVFTRNKAGEPESSPMEKVERLKIAGDALIAELQLLNRLFAVEWAEQRGRIVQMMAMGMVAFMALLCILLFGGVAVVVIAWDTGYRDVAAVMALLVYILLGVWAWTKLRQLSRHSKDAFAATREELAADVALLKSKLWP